MKRFFILIIFAVTLSLNFTSQKIAAPQTAAGHLALDLSTIDNSSRNILIHSLAFQRYNRIKYAALSGHHFSVNKMMDTPDHLMSIN